MARNDDDDDVPESKKAKPKKAAPKRNPVERAVVWGFILVALVLVAFQYRARANYMRSSEAVLNELKARGEADKELRLEEAEKLMSGYSGPIEEKKPNNRALLVYKFAGIRSYTLKLQVMQIPVAEREKWEVEAAIPDGQENDDASVQIIPDKPAEAGPAGLSPNAGPAGGPGAPGGGGAGAGRPPGGGAAGPLGGPPPPRLPGTPGGPPLTPFNSPPEKKNDETRSEDPPKDENKTDSTKEDSKPDT